MPEYRTPGVYIEEISGGPRPVQPSSTTNTGFVGMVTLPQGFVAGRAGATGLYLPSVEDQLRLSWTRALAFRPLVGEAVDEAPAAPAGTAATDADPKAKKPAPKAEVNRFQRLVGEVLPGKWEIAPANGDNTVTMTSEKGDVVRFPVSKTLMSVKVTERGTREWDLVWGADEQKALEIVAANATLQGVKHSGNLACVDPGKKPLTVEIGAIHDRMVQPAPSITSMAGYHQWRFEFGQRLFREILLESGTAPTPGAGAGHLGHPLTAGPARLGHLAAEPPRPAPAGDRADRLLRERWRHRLHRGGGPGARRRRPEQAPVPGAVLRQPVVGRDGVLAGPGAGVAAGAPGVRRAEGPR